MDRRTDDMRSQDRALHYSASRGKNDEDAVRQTECRQLQLATRNKQFAAVTVQRQPASLPSVNRICQVVPICNGSLGPRESVLPQTVQRFCGVIVSLNPEILCFIYAFQWAGHSVKNVLSRRGSGSPSETWLFEPTRVHTPNRLDRL